METFDLFIRAYGYAALFAAMVIEQFIPPMPGEPLLLGAGALAGTGRFNVWLAAGLAVAGTVAGDLVWYEVGRLGGHRVLKWMCRLSIAPDSCIRNGADTLARRGANALLIAKFLPGLNSIGQPLAGALGMPRRRFVVFDLLGAGLWVGLYIGLGYAVHDQLAEAAVIADWLGGWAVAIAAGAIGLYLGIKVTRRQLFLRALRIWRISPEELEEKLRANEPVFVVDVRHELDVQAQPTMIPGPYTSPLPRSSRATSRSRGTTRWCFTAPDRTRRRAPGWRSCSASAVLSGFGRSPADSRPGRSTASPWSR